MQTPLQSLVHLSLWTLVWSIALILPNHQFRDFAVILLLPPNLLCPWITTTPRPIALIRDQHWSWWRRSETTSRRILVNLGWQCYMHHLYPLGCLGRTLPPVSIFRPGFIWPRSERETTEDFFWSRNKSTVTHGLVTPGGYNEAGPPRLRLHRINNTTTSKFWSSMWRVVDLAMWWIKVQ